MASAKADVPNRDSWQPRGVPARPRPRGTPAPARVAKLRPPDRPTHRPKNTTGDLSAAGGSGADEDRTHNLLNAIQALSQLSYRPKWEGRQYSVHPPGEGPQRVLRSAFGLRNPGFRADLRGILFAPLRKAGGRGPPSNLELETIP